MNCCPQADFTFLSNGLQVRERNIQSDTSIHQFFPYRAIQTVRYSHSRDDGGTISIWVLATGSPGAGGISYRYLFPCTEAGRVAYDKLIAAI